MIDWYNIYDKNTYLVPFEKTDYRFYSPFQLDSEGLLQTNKKKDNTEFNSLFKKTNSMAHMISHFKIFLKTMSPLAQIVKDPFSAYCFEYIRKICLAIFNELQNANLIVTEHAHSPNEPDTEGKDQNLRQEEDFKEKSMQVSYWASSELFYLFTTICLITPNDQRKFYRQRILFSCLRIFYSKAYIRKYVLASMTKNAILDQFKEDFLRRIDFLKDLTDILLRQIRQYELVNPLELLVIENIYKFELEFTNDKIKTDFLVREFKKEFNLKMNEMQNGPSQVIYEELIGSNREYENFWEQKDQNSIFTPSQQSMMNKSNQSGKRSTSDLGSESRSKNETPETSPLQTPNNYENKSERISERDYDDMKSQRSAKTKNSKAKINKLKLIQKNIKEDRQSIEEQIRNDKDIDHDRIKKALKYNDDQKFLTNYEKIKSGNPQLLNAKDRLAFEKRQKHITVCKQLFNQQIRRQSKPHMQVILEDLRNQIEQNIVGEEPLKQPGQIEIEQLDMNESFNSISQKQYLNTNKPSSTEFNKRNQLRRMGTNRSQADRERDVSNEGRDLVDDYLLDKYGIKLALVDDNLDNESHEALYSNNLSQPFSKSETSESNLSARILQNPVYQHMPFYPFRDLHLWLQFEENRKYEASINRAKETHQRIALKYMTQLQTQVKEYLKNNPQNPELQIMLDKLRQSESADESGEDTKKYEQLFKSIFGDHIDEEIKQWLNQGNESEAKKLKSKNQSPDIDTHQDKLNKQIALQRQQEEERKNKMDKARKLADGFFSKTQKAKQDDSQDLQFISTSYRDSQNLGEFIGQSSQRQQALGFRDMPAQSFFATKQINQQSRNSIISQQESNVFSSGEQMDLIQSGERIARQTNDLDMSISQNLRAGMLGQSILSQGHQVNQGFVPQSANNALAQEADGVDYNVDFDKFLNLEQINANKHYDGVNKKKKLGVQNQNNIGVNQIVEKQGLFFDGIELRTGASKDAPVDKRPIRMKWIQSGI